MTDWFSAHRGIAVVVAVLAAVVVGAVAWACTVPSSSDGLSMGDYGPDKQGEWAERLVTGLNTREVNQVPLLQPNGVLSAEQRQTVEAVMPAPGCGYHLVSVEDRGEQGRQQVPGLSTESSTYRFDMTVEARCPDKQPLNRTIGVVAIAEMSYWEPFYFVP
ncbi:hypothetical protein BA059_05210 [Mycolicibacterium sp. (ex Dasyatis americana)]|uniref:hypothetical protein n=1 Tax=Mycobacterium sp. CnD-18-1 TaxID=2917744 RepID=UPI0008727A0E|nr:hypothetical protein [Mycobacterium sp. CnD-18-1]MCG7609672.1 hypothetical protein [Mycobacterium sp. CnD-18-1]OFB42603.1 hypothetical protein BA059_05210 [Mycolicibacterium sp. (ex Dasyatis americana)]